MKMTLTAMLLAAALGCTSTSTSTSTPTSPTSSPSPTPIPTPMSSPAPINHDAPVASFASADQQTGERIAALLGGAGISWVSYGSIGSTVAVPTSQAGRARALLIEAVNADGLAASVLDFDGTNVRVIAPIATAPTPPPPPPSVAP
jgi:hypothetical protein